MYIPVSYPLDRKSRGKPVRHYLVIVCRTVITELRAPSLSTMAIGVEFFKCHTHFVVIYDEMVQLALP